jgi:CubicO group peptidase (beta-lactamase class C family)
VQIAGAHYTSVDPVFSSVQGFMNRITLLALLCYTAPANLPAQETRTREPSSYVYRVPPRASDGWDVGHYRDQGLDSALLAGLMSAIRGGELSNIHSVLIVKGGKLVVEEYFTGSDERRGARLGNVTFDQSTLHDLRSVTKSVTGTLLGIAMATGIVRADESVFAIFPEHADLATGPKARMTISDLLTMRSGLAWDETTFPYTDVRNHETAMDQSASSVRFVLGLNSIADPGTKFAYCGGCTMLLAATVRKKAGKDLDAYARDVLFTPLGITNFEWLRHRDGLPIAASGLRLRPRDFAKIGYVHVNNGRWNGNQVLPEQWIGEWTRERLRLDSTTAYGYQWWIDYEGRGADRYPVMVARGNGGQRIYVIPKTGLVAVITAGNYNSAAGSRVSEQAFWRYILPATLPR